MFQGPYRVAIMAPGAGPTDEQKVWILQRLKYIATCVRSLGWTEEIAVEVQCVKTRAKETPHWFAHLRRPQHVELILDMGPTWKTGEAPAIVSGLMAWPADEVWCLNADGHSGMSRHPIAQVYRAGIADESLAHHFKLVPSWVGYADYSTLSTQKPKKGKQPCLNNWS